MSPSEHNEAGAPAPISAVHRVVVYIAALAALCVILWAILQGSERDLWTQTSGGFAYVTAFIGP